MAGVYFHIPFCKQACHYCDFHFSTSLKQMPDVWKAMLKELELQADYLHGHTVETIYFGGGTPSLLEPHVVDQFLNQISAFFKVSGHPEITFEANPDDLSENHINGLRKTAINRFSVGVQSFFEEDLRWMNRAHHAKDSMLALCRLQDAGFENISVDLIYGYPLLSLEKWHHNLKQVIDLNIPHISAYSMTVEPRTALASFVERGLQSPMEDGQSAKHFHDMLERLNDADYQQYEISNFALNDRYSIHNSNYWRGIPYLGIGPSAHSYNGAQRQWNVSNNMLYLKQINLGEIPAEKEILSTKDKVNEYIMTSLRTIWGMDLGLIAKRFGSHYAKVIENALPKHIEQGKAILHDRVATLTPAGKLMANSISADLFIA